MTKKSRNPTKSIAAADCGAGGKFKKHYHCKIIGNAVFNVKVKSMTIAVKLSIKKIICIVIFMHSVSKKNLTNSEFKGNCKKKNNFCDNNQFDITGIHLCPFICSTVERGILTHREYLPCNVG
jgi:hypothetical protein